MAQTRDINVGYLDDREDEHDGPEPDEDSLDRDTMPMRWLRYVLRMNEHGKH